MLRLTISIALLRTVKMNFSIRRWITLIASDTFIRAVYFLFGSANIFFLPISLFLTVIHLMFFTFINYAVITYRFPPWVRIAAIVIATNVVFVGFVVFIWVSMIKSGHQSACSGFGPDQVCSWEKGEISWAGVKDIAVFMAIQVIINIAVVLVARGRDARQPGTATPRAQ